MKVPDLVDSEDIAELLELSHSTTIKDIIEPVKKAMDLFASNISTMAFLPDVQRLTIRIETLHDLLDGFRQHLTKDEFNRVLATAGEDAGRQFAHDLIDFLSKHGKLAKNEQVLLNLWQEFDSMAGWGSFAITKTPERIVVEVTDLFITKGLAEEKDRYIAFMEG